MRVCSRKLIEIVQRSSSLSKHLHNRLPSAEQADDSYLTDARISKWCQAITDGDLKRLEKRLAWDGLSLDDIRIALSADRLVDKDALPAWSATLKDALEAAAPVCSEDGDKNSVKEKRCLNSKNPLPFETLFLSFVTVARQKLQLRANSSYSILSSDSHATLEQYLLKSLTDLCSRALIIEFQAFRACEQPKLNRWLGQAQQAHSREQYDKFIHTMLSGGLLTFFQEYSVLARLAATVTDFWVNNTCEFLQRLALDWSALQATFQSGGVLGQVASTKIGISDLHNNGRSVILVTFASGLRLVYKPKSLGMDKAFFQLLDWCNKQDISQPLKLLRFLNCSDYGWVEYVEHLPCSDEQAGARYYKRAGNLLCLLYALSGADLHWENVIACGDQPVLIDLEMLMSTAPRQEEALGSAEASQTAFKQIAGSVLSTSFLPKWEAGREGRIYDASGLGGSGGQQTCFYSPVWQNINSDGMVLRYECVRTLPKSNLPMIGGTYLSPSDYVEKLVDGFCEMYRCLIANRETLLSENSPLSGLLSQQVRAIFRPSQVYASIIQHALQPKFLREGIDFSIALDVLSKAFLKFESKPNTWQIVAAEQEALANLDIPLFTTHPNRDDLTLTSHQTIERYFVEPSCDLVTRRLQQLNQKDLEQQVGFIRSSLYMLVANKVTQPRSRFTPHSLHSETIYAPTKESLIQQAVSIAQNLQDRALRSANGSLIWLGMDYLSEAGRLQQKTMIYDLYDGSAGIALFLSALAKVVDSARFRDLAFGALQPLVDLAQNSVCVSEQNLVKQIGIGGAKGLGSLIYALVQSSQFLTEPTFLQAAQQLALQINSTAIAADTRFDVVSGTAGTILGLLKLYQATGSSAVLELAKSCGYHLLDSCVTSDTGHRAWATVAGKLLTGFSHGAAGIAYALLRLYTVASDPRFLQGAEEAIAYERSVFSSQAQNWPDFRMDRPGFSASWCSGAPGVGLARLGGLAILNTEKIQHDIEVALQTTQKFCFQEIDHLCCGNFGRAEVLLVAAQKLKRPELLDAAQKQAAYAIRKAERTSSFQLFPKQFKGLYNPGFFQGSAGIGYELLRLAPLEQQLPSVLLWE